jgi:hypothetical protein|tara:strand:- start:154 stop:360 length:207 start_codon:yes stop_codon:yes gene_type:complete
MDIKTIATGIGIVITIASLFVFQGQLIQRVEVLEARSIPNIAPLEKELSVLKTQVEEIKARNSNPLMR